MEARIGSERGRLYGTGGELELNLNGVGRTRFDWDLNDWNWDGELLIARPRPVNGNTMGNGIGNGNGIPPASNSSSSCSEENGIVTIATVQNETERKRRVMVTEEESGAGSLSLRIGGNGDHLMGNGHVNGGEERDAKKGKVQGASNSSRPICQVEGCGTDLSGSKDYHRRHKVCEMHAKATTAVVGNSVQRFCQQCSRFHLLEEFDEGKRSCRRRLAGHNKRRRKTQPDPAIGGAHSLDDRTAGCLIVTLLKVLSSLHSNNGEQTKDQDLAMHLVRNLANLAGSIDLRTLAGLIQSSPQSQQKAGSSAGPSSEAANPAPAAEPERVRANGAQGQRSSLSLLAHMEQLHPNGTALVTALEPAINKARLKDFDLNDAYNVTAEDSEAVDGCNTRVTLAYNGNGNSSPNCPSWMQQGSGQSDSSSAQSLSSSNGDAQCRTDRIVFKLFGKDPHDIPLVLRSQILDWLSNTPTDVESHIRPGCIILTIYLRLPESEWAELCDDLSFHIERLLSNCTDDFWQSGWIYARVQHEIVFIYNGRVLVDDSLPLNRGDYSQILCVRPVAVPYSPTATFTIKGFNLASSSMRVICSFEGKYLFQESTQNLAVTDSDSNTENERFDWLSFSCTLPNATRGRGFIEVEEQGFSNGFFPFIVAEKEVCSEIRVLEDSIDSPNPENNSARNQALYFLNELGWLLRKTNSVLKSKKKTEPGAAPGLLFHPGRFRWLAEFAMDREWCSVVKLLLDLLFTGAVDLDGRSPCEILLSENLLHDAVKRNSRPLVEALLRYLPDKKLVKERSDRECYNYYIFRPDAPGPDNLTPLHIAASSSGMEGVLDALTSDSEMVGINAWKTVRDDGGQTPEDYARATGRELYLSLVQRKIDRQLEKSHVVVGIPGDISPFEISSNKAPTPVPARPYCNLCTRHVGSCRTSTLTRTFLYRPALLTMLGIAAVCVCVGLLLKTPPKVICVVPSFRWELLGHGPR